MAKPGRPPSLTRERIVQAVVEQLELNGNEPVTTRTVGQSLGVHPTALYRHFSDMDELLRAAADLVLAEVFADVEHAGPGVPGAPPAERLQAVRALCRRLRAALMSHPGATRVMSAGPSLQANERKFTEHLLELLRQAGLPNHDCVMAYHALVEFVVGSCVIDTPVHNGHPELEAATHAGWRHVYLHTDPGSYPIAAELSGLMYPSQDDQFEYGLGLIIDGLATRARAVSSATDPTQ